MTAKSGKPKGWKPVSVAQQKLNTQKQIRHLRRKKPVPVAQQRKAHHHQLVLAHKAKVAKAHHHAKAKTRGAPLTADGVPCCAAQAVAEAIRIASATVLSEQDVLTLHRQAGGTERHGASIPGTLESSRGFAPSLRFDVLFAPPHDLAQELDLFLVGLEPVAGQQHLLILGLDLPDGQSHAVVAHDGVWWSWGEPYEPRSDVVITEAWAVTW